MVNTQESILHQIAISGQVSNAHTGRGIGGARVEITVAPVAFTEWLAIRAIQYGTDWDNLLERPDRTLTAADGHFHFIDLPDGSYTLVASLPEAGTRYGTVQVTATVSRDIDGNIIFAVADMALPPTTLRGLITVTDQFDTYPVVMAEVVVKGSGERAFSNGQGRYYLIGIESGNRAVLMTAPGFVPVPETALIPAPGAEKQLDFMLMK